MEHSFDYDIALSFSGQDRKHAERLAKHLAAEGIRVFYDAFETANLWGEDLYTHLADIYLKKARYCVMFLSQHYASSLWTSHERRFAQARAFRENSAYILPLKLDDTEISGIADTTAYVDLRETTIEEVVLLLQSKLASSVRGIGTKPAWQGMLTAYAEKTRTNTSKDLGVQFYIPLRYEALNTEGKVDEAIRRWLCLPQEPLRVVLGDYGTGKTTVCLQMANKLCEEIIHDPTTELIPLYIPLRDSSRFFRMADPLGTLLEYYSVPGKIGASKTYFVMFDGYDELLDAGDRSSFHVVLRDLLTRSNVKTLLTARSHFFRTHYEALSKLASETRRGSSLESVLDETDWLAERTMNLLELTSEDIRAYLSMRFEGDASGYFDKLISIYDLADLAKRPVLLSLIVRVLPEIDELDIINQDSLYETTVQSWLNREAWRGLNTDAIMIFMENLAKIMFLQQVLDIHYSELSNRIRESFQAEILSRMDAEYFDNLVRTSGFLFRDGEGRFSFMHRSFLEYFFGRVLQKHVNEDRLILVANEELREMSFFDFSETWRDASDVEQKKQQAIKLVNSKLKMKYDRAYSLSDGIVELLLSSLQRKQGKHVVTQRMGQFVTKREKFREDERALERHAARIRGRLGSEPKTDEDVRRAFQRVGMIGGEGRIYYTVEKYSFSLFVNSRNFSQPWALVLGYYETFRHT